jgi:XTP/dITP diphosphohydrolase
MTKLVIASTNVHKIREFRQMLKGFRDVELVSLIDFPHYQPPEETESTFEGNAQIKATHAAQTLQLLALADDSGLVVPTLNNSPGVYSARYAGEEATDRENRAKLLQALRGKDEFDRSAYFECCLVLANPERVLHQATGRCEGRIIEEERGGNGFGYDPIFIKNDYDKTFAELDDTTKNKVSHRRKAFEKMMIYLESHLSKWDKN